jgi:hypothetical protein
MTEISNGQDQRSCSDARLLLERRILEDILSPEEQKSIKEHLNQCKRCRDLERLTFALPFFTETASNGELDGSFVAVVQGLHREREMEMARRQKVRWGVIAGAAATLTLFGLAMLHEPEKAPPIRTASVQCHPSAPTELASGVHMTHCSENEPESRLENGAVRVDLRSGAVALFVDPARPEKKSVTVETSLGDVRVKGTLFTVRMVEGDARVDVYRGTVAVIPKQQRLAYDVPAGRGSMMKHRSTFECTAPTTDSLLKALPVPPPIESAGRDILRR